MKVKKWLSVILAIAMVMTSIVIPSDQIVSAANMTGEDTEIAEEQSTEEVEEPEEGAEQNLPETQSVLMETEETSVIDTDAEQSPETVEEAAEAEEQSEVIEEAPAEEEATDIPEAFEEAAGTEESTGSEGIEEEITEDTAKEEIVEDPLQEETVQQGETEEESVEQPSEENIESDKTEEELTETPEKEETADAGNGEEVIGETVSEEDSEIKQKEESEKQTQSDTDTETQDVEKDEILKDKDSSEKDKKQEEQTEKEADKKKKSKAAAQKKEETEETGADMPQTYSLLPLEEIHAYLILSRYTEQELTNMSVDHMLSLLQDSDGNPVPIAEDATTVWKYTLDDSGIEEYEEYSIGKNETINLYPGDGAESFQMELIVGKEGQLNIDNKRYLVSVELKDNFEEDFDVEIYLQDSDENRVQAVPENCNKWSFMYSDGVTEEAVFDLSFGADIVGSLSDYGTVWLNFKSELAEDPRVDIKIYPVIVMDFGYVTIKKDIAEQVLNQDMTQIAAGYQIAGDKNTDETFEMVIYVDGAEYSKKYIGVRYWNWYPRHEGTVFLKEGDERVNVYENLSSEFDAENHVNEITFELKQDYSASEQYYFDYDLVMQKNFGGASGETQNFDGLVEKVVIGHYDSKEEAEAAGAEDITDDILRNGYLADYSGDGLDVTVFKTYRMSQSFPLIYDTLADKVNIKVIDNHNKLKEYTNAPVIGEADPWFRVTGVNDSNGNPCDTYIVENGKNINMDTMYGYGYQTVFINENVDEIQPTFWMADSDNIKVKSIYINEGTLFQAGDTIVCSSPETSVTFHVTIEDQNGEHTKNYNVSFVKKCSGPQLYVAGPKGTGENDPVRSVFLDEYFEYKHDIFIANIGDEPLTGLRVELDATNCKLDDYWLVGGQNNNTLAAFDSTQPSAEYGELANIAKIRLLPDGDGEINGTLTIYADGQDPVTITLSGLAQNPKIITNGLDEAVKYVPYSYMVSTNNMYDWTDVEFTMTGDLPEGVEFIEETGEIYGVPQETGTFPVTVTAAFKSDTYEFDSSNVELTLTVKENTNDNVYEATDDEYQILESIGEDTAGDHDFVLKETGEQLFVSNGEFDEFQALWLNGKKLVDGVDYTKEAGSTRITISSQTFENKVNKDGTNTIAAEFRTDDNYENELKRTAQNFRLDISQGNPSEDQPSSGDDNPGGNTDTPGSGDDGENQSGGNQPSGGDSSLTPDTGNNGGNQDNGTTDDNGTSQGGNGSETGNNGSSQSGGNQSSGGDSSLTPNTGNNGGSQGNGTTGGNGTSQGGNGIGAGNDGNSQGNGNNQGSGNSGTSQNSGNSQNYGNGANTGNNADSLGNGVSQGNGTINRNQNTGNNGTVQNQNSNQNGSGTGSAQSGAGSTAASTPYVTMFTQITDKDNTPLENYIVEIHSTPKTGTTNENGVVKFSDVEFGKHSISVKKTAADTAVTKEFQIQEGTNLALNGDVITAKKGSAFTLKVKLDGDQLTLVSVEATDVKTEDTIPVTLWLSIFAAACTVLAGALVLRKRKAEL